jgi:hypothetical protein
VIAWSGVLNNGPVNFLLPLLVSLRALASDGGTGEVDNSEDNADVGSCMPCALGREEEGTRLVAREGDARDKVLERTSVRPLPKVGDLYDGAIHL